MASCGTYSEISSTSSLAGWWAFISSSQTSTTFPSTSTPLTVWSLSTSTPQPLHTTLVFCWMRLRQAALWKEWRSILSVSVALYDLTGMDIKLNADRKPDHVALAVICFNGVSTAGLDFGAFGSESAFFAFAIVPSSPSIHRIAQAQPTLCVLESAA